MSFEIWSILLAIGLITSVFLQAPWIGIICVSIFIILLFAKINSKNNIDGIKYIRKFRYNRGFPGECLEGEVFITNHKFLPVSKLTLMDTWPEFIAPTDSANIYPSHIDKHLYWVNSSAILPSETIRRSITISLKSRGIFRIGPVEFSSYDVFGINPISQTQETYDYITVYPEIIALESLGLNTEDPFGLINSKNRIFEDPMQFIGIREYHPEDNLRKVHWNATARTGQLQVKIHQPVSENVVMICMDVSTTQHLWHGINSEQLEHLIRISASVSYYLFQQNFSVGFFSNGCQSYSDQPTRIFPSRSREQIPAILKAHAGLTQFTTTKFAYYLLEKAVSFPYGATLIAITANLSQELIKVFDQLKKYHFNSIIIYTGSDAPNDNFAFKLIHLPLTTEVQE
ncbi:MAG: hypothetical protein CVU39_02300 [Chloroflexi bacterium HGW-Chloroflexi-10]|nr:MAG: hypothetical protein CVU39_02300 [Chloroflexi bacterium HGW-Chloroflexi-10]